MAQLTRARDRSMHSIVATIQAEQDEAIRAPAKGVVTIAGGPGTGKTVVALHRAAFLLYTDRRRYETRRRARGRPVGRLHALHRAGAAVARRDRGRAALARRGRRRRPRRSAATTRRSPRSRARRGWPRCCGVRRARRCPAPPRSSASSTATTCSTSAPASCRDPAAAARPGHAATGSHHRGGLDADRRAVAPGPRRAGARARPRTSSSTRCAATDAFLDFAREPGGRCSTRSTCSAGCATPSCSPGSPTACSTTSRSRLRGEVVGRRPQRRRRAAARRAALPARRPADHRPRTSPTRPGPARARSTQPCRR